MNIFTNNDYRRIQAWLKANAIKDSEFAISENTIPDEDILVITQNMSTVPTNYKIKIKDLLNSSLGKVVIDKITANIVKVNNTLTVDASKVILNNEKGTTLQDVLNYFEENKLNRHTDDTFDGNLTVKKNITIEGNIKSHDDTITVEADLKATGEITDGHGNLLNDVNSAAKQWSLEYQDSQQDEPTVRAKYVLKDYRGVPKGSVIKIYKDSAITNVYLGTIEDTCNPDTGEVTKHPIHDNNEALSIVYRLDTGKYSLVNIPIKIFATEAEFDKYRGLGVTSNGQVFIKLASDVESSNYLHFNELGEITADGIETRILRDLGDIITSIAGDDTMWGVYKEHEGTKDSPINDNSRWGQYKQAEANRSELLNTVSSKVNQLEQEQIQGGVYDVSAHNDEMVFESLQDLLSRSDLSTLIPISVRRGGMTIKFIQNSVVSPNNKYVQYRLMSNTFNTTLINWQGVDNEPIDESENLVKSGGIASYIKKSTPIVKHNDNTDLDIEDDDNNIILRLQNGHIKTKNFTSEDVTTTTKEVFGDFSDFEIGDSDGNIIVAFKNGKPVDLSGTTPYSISTYHQKFIELENIQHIKRVIKDPELWDEIIYVTPNSIKINSSVSEESEITENNLFNSLKTLIRTLYSNNKKSIKIIFSDGIYLYNNSNTLLDIRNVYDDLTLGLYGSNNTKIISADRIYNKLDTKVTHNTKDKRWEIPSDTSYAVVKTANGNYNANNLRRKFIDATTLEVINIATSSQDSFYKRTFAKEVPERVLFNNVYNLLTTAHTHKRCSSSWKKVVYNSNYTAYSNSKSYTKSSNPVNVGTDTDFSYQCISTTPVIGVYPYTTIENSLIYDIEEAIVAIPQAERAGYISLRFKTEGSTSEAHYNLNKSVWSDNPNDWEYNLYRVKDETLDDVSVEECEARYIYIYFAIKWVGFWYRITKIENGYIYFIRQNVYHYGDDAYNWTDGQEINHNGIYAIINLDNQNQDNGVIKYENKTAIPEKYEKVYETLNTQFINCGAYGTTIIDGITFYGGSPITCTGKRLRTTNNKFIGCDTSISFYTLWDDTTHKSIAGECIINNNYFIKSRLISAEGCCDIINNTFDNCYEEFDIHTHGFVQLNGGRDDYYIANNSFHNYGYTVMAGFGGRQLSYGYGIIEYNILYNDGDWEKRKRIVSPADTGAIYTGPINNQLIIRYNIFTAPTSTGQARCIMLDDGAEGGKIYGNIFYNGSKTAAIGLRSTMQNDGTYPNASDYGDAVLKYNTNNYIGYNFINTPNAYTFGGRKSNDAYNVDMTGIENYQSKNFILCKNKNNVIFSKSNINVEDDYFINNFEIKDGLVYVEQKLIDFITTFMPLKFVRKYFRTFI